MHFDILMNVIWKQDLDFIGLQEDQKKIHMLRERSKIKQDKN